VAELDRKSGGANTKEWVFRVGWGAKALEISLQPAPKKISLQFDAKLGGS
jgi:hypothetical protein